MTLAAQQVVDLVAGIVAAAQPSYDNRTDKPWPADEAGLTSFAVSDEGDENTGTDVHSDPVEIHDLTTRITLRVSSVDSLNAAMSAATAAVLTSVNSPSARAALAAAGVRVWSWQRTGRDRQRGGQASVGLVDIDFLARYAVLASAPETILT